MLKNGPYDIVTFAMDQWLDQMRNDLIDYTETIKNYDGEGATKIVKFNELDTSQKLKLGLRTRLELMSPYEPKWGQAIALGA